MQSVKFSKCHPKFKENLFNYLLHFKYGCYFNSNGYHPAIPGWKNEEDNFDLVVAVSNEAFFPENNKNVLDEFANFRKKEKSWLFGHLTYDLKNEIEDLRSENPDGLQFPALSFFPAQFIFLLKGNELEILVNDKTPPEQVFNEVKNIGPPVFMEKYMGPIHLQQRIEKAEYLRSVTSLKEHIARGDIYEINFCMEFFAENCLTDPAQLYFNLNKISPAPFSAFYKTDHQYLMSSSPERYIKKTGNTIVSQPIKGTIKRGKNKVEDDALQQQLKNDLKEQSENVMIVDLVRNDLARIAKEKTVKVEELFGIYPFQQVHQMISTISAELKTNTSFEEIIKNTFPMGSMTGAPKLRAMQLIEQYEQSKRGLYSGALGYITPEGDFDFSVVIRSILYNAEKEYLSFSVGSAITENADPEKEYDECLLKAKAMKQALGIM